MLSPLYCVVKLRYALSASSIESSDSQGLETISWSSARPLIECSSQGGNHRSHHRDFAQEERCRSAGLAGYGVKAHYSRTAGAPRPRAPFPTELDLGLRGVVSQGTHPVLLCRGRRGWRCGMCWRRGRSLAPVSTLRATLQYSSTRAQLWTGIRGLFEMGVLDSCWLLGQVIWQ